MTNATLQIYMQKCIKTYKFKEEDINSVNMSMAGIWKVARTTLQISEAASVAPH